MTPSEYFRDLIEPTIAEFEQNPTSIRHAYAACLFVYHFADVAAVQAAMRGRKTGRPLAQIRKEIEQNLGRIREELAHLAPAFGVVQGIVTMAKRIELTDPGLTVRPKIEDTPIGGEAEEVVRTRDAGGNPVDVLWCVREARLAIETYLGRLRTA